MSLLAILLILSYIIYLFSEKNFNDKYLASFKYIIHVNGIRGKTSVCRIIDANLRSAGYRVFTKTTGTTAFYIDTNGKEHLINRRTSPNIKEQLSMIKMAYKEKAEIFIVECMAVDPELQKVSQKNIVKGNLNVITNVRYDHIFDMGESLDEIANSLSNTVPQNGMLFTSDENYFDYFSKKCISNNSKVILCKIDKEIENENYAIAYEIGKVLGINREQFLKNTKVYIRDFGAHKLYKLHNNINFLNLFSVNDPQSTKKILYDFTDDREDITYIYNHRVDRPDRLLLFSERFFNILNYKRIIIIGENRNFAVRFLRKKGIKNVTELADWRNIFNIKDSNLIVGVGNIKDSGYELINHLEGGIANE